MSKEFKGLTLGALENMSKPGGSGGFAMAVLLPLFIAIDIVLYVLFALLPKKENIGKRNSDEMNEPKLSDEEKSINE